MYFAYLLPYESHALSCHSYMVYLVSVTYRARALLGKLRLERLNLTDSSPFLNLTLPKTQVAAHPWGRCHPKQIAFSLSKDHPRLRVSALKSSFITDPCRPLLAHGWITLVYPSFDLSPYWWTSPSVPSPLISRVPHQSHTIQGSWLWSRSDLSLIPPLHSPLPSLLSLT